MEAATGRSGFEHLIGKATAPFGHGSVAVLEHPVRRVARFDEHANQLGNVFRPARLHGDVDHGVAQMDAEISAVVHQLNNVGALRRYTAGELVKAAGPVRESDSQPD